MSVPSFSLEESFASTLTNLDPDEVDKVRKAAEKVVGYLARPGDDVGLLYGKVQSGKTNGTIMSIARANDFNFRFFVVLTSDNVSLYKQTLDRVKSGLPVLLVLGNDDLKNLSGLLGRARVAMKQKGVVIVSKKNKPNLDTLENFLNTLDVSNAKAVVFDDEADFGSLNSKINKEEQSVIHSLIRRLRSTFNETKFIQVTATPQAVFLQREEGGFKPRFTVQVPPGKGYVGGDELFDLESENVRANIQREIDVKEINQIMKHEDYTQYGLTALPHGIRRAVSCFYVGASFKMLGGRGGDKFSMLCHISSKQSAHKSLYSLVNRYVEIILDSLDDQKKEFHAGIESDLKSAYSDIAKTSVGPPSWEEVKATISNNMYSTTVQIIIGGNNGQNPTYESPFNILVGGDRLGRGLTIKNLLVTYYGRMSGGPKVDTILQHSRMYGYRKSDLDVMRVFSTPELFRIYYDVYTSDKEEWDYFASEDYKVHSPVILSLTKNGKVRPTRTQVVPIENILKYFPGKAYIMYWANSENFTKISEILKAFDGKQRAPIECTFEMIIELISLVKTDNPEQKWNPSALISAIKNIEKIGKEPEDTNFQSNDKVITPYIIVRRERDITKGYRSVLDESDQKIKYDKGLILFMYQVVGGKDKGWDGNHLWVPVVRFPAGNAYYFTTSYNVPAGGEESGSDE